MKKRKVKFNYEKLRPLDMVVCAGKSPFAVVTRIVTAGRRRAFDYDVSVHTGILVDFHGQLLVAEMTAQGLQINSLEKYNTVGGRRWVIAVRRHRAFDDTGLMEETQETIARDRRKTIEYDYKGLLEFVSKRVKDNKKRYYCSEYVYHATKFAGVKYPTDFADMVSPFDLQHCPEWHGVEFEA